MAREFQVGDRVVFTATWHVSGVGVSSVNGTSDYLIATPGKVGVVEALHMGILDTGKYEYIIRLLDGGVMPYVPQSYLAKLENV